MDTTARVDRVLRNCSEVLTRDELQRLFEREQRPKAYIGFEPSGQLTIGHLITALKMRDLQQAGCELTLFLADWHAWINDKLGGSLERIGAAGNYMVHAFEALGVDTQSARVRWAHELCGRPEYWTRVVRVAKATSLARTKRAMTILGREENEATLDTGKLFYPAMQVADIFELPVDLAYAGVDQRRAHVLAREAAHHYAWPVPVAVHTPLVSSLKGGARMDLPGAAIDRKMSKSDPTGAVPVPARPEQIRERVSAAFCPAREVEGNPIVEIVCFIAFPWEGRFHVERKPEHGGPIDFESPEPFLAAWRSGKLHPGDVKPAAAEVLGRILQPASRYFEQHPEALEFLAPAVSTGAARETVK